MSDRRHIEVVNTIIQSLSDHRDLGQEWDQIDEDTQEEIRQKWIALVKSIEEE